MRSFWEEAVDLARCISATTVARRFRDSYGLLRRLPPHETSGWKRSLQHWHSTGVAHSNPLWALAFSLIAIKEMKEPEPPKDDPWFLQYLKDSLGLFAFITGLLEHLRSRLPGYPHLEFVHRCRPLPNWMFCQCDITCYGNSLPRYGSKPPCFSSEEWSRVKKHVDLLEQSLVASRVHSEMKIAAREIASDQGVRQELAAIVSAYDEFVRDGKPRTVMATYQRARQYRERSYEQASQWTRSMYERWKAAEEMMLDLYFLLSTWTSGGRILKFSWPSDEIEDVGFERKAHHLTVRLRTSTAPGLLIADPGDVMALDFDLLDKRLSGLCLLDRKVTRFHSGSLTFDILGQIIPDSRESVPRV